MTNELLVKIKGVDIRVEEAGQGQPIILLHGFSGDKHVWDESWEMLSRNHRVLRYDLRGFGESESKNDEPFSHSDDLFQIVNSLEIECCNLLGISMGASVALNYSLNYPESVNRLVLTSPGITAWEWSDSWNESWNEIKSIARTNGIQDAKDMWYMHPLFQSTRLREHSKKKLIESMKKYSGSHWVSGDAEIESLPDLERVPFLKPPTLLLSGTDDLLDFQLIASAIHELAPSVKRLNYESAGHMLNFEFPDRFVNDVMEFLQ